MILNCISLITNGVEYLFMYLFLFMFPFLWNSSCLVFDWVFFLCNVKILYVCFKLWTLYSVFHILVFFLILHHLISLCCSLLFYSDLFFFSRGELIWVCFFGEPGAYQPSPVSGSSLIQELFLHKVCYPIIVNGLKWATASHVLSSVLWFQLTPHLLSPLQLSL